MSRHLWRRGWAFYMPGWLIKRMPEMRNQIELEATGGGVTWEQAW